MSIANERLPKCPVPTRLAIEIGEALGVSGRMQSEWTRLVHCWKRRVGLNRGMTQ